MQTFELEGKRILELGCGLALASLVIHRRGGDITASDCHPLAAAFLLENLKLNDLPAMKYQAGNWSRLNPLLTRFDLIIGSDVLYDREQPQVLSQFIELHANPDVEVLIIDPIAVTGQASTQDGAVGLLSHGDTCFGAAWQWRGLQGANVALPQELGSAKSAKLRRSFRFHIIRERVGEADKVHG